MSNAYCDLTTLKSSTYLDISSTGEDAFLRALVQAASRAIDNYCKRFFYVLNGTRYYDGAGQFLWPDDILSITTFKTDDDCDGTFENTWTENQDYESYPLNSYPKYRLEIPDRVSRLYSNFNCGVRKGIQIVGQFGYGDGVSATPYTDSGVVLNTGGMTNSVLTHALASGKGASFAIGQTVLIGTEQLYITGISSDTLTFLGNPTRAQNGTTAAAHLAGDKIYIYQYPELVKQACLLQTMKWWKRKGSGFANVIGNVELGTTEYYKSLDPDFKFMLGSGDLIKDCV